jgi:hypothetical protein
MFTSRLSHRLAGLAAGTLLVPLVLAGVGAIGATAASASPLVGFSTYAYGTSATLGVAGATAGSGPSAPASLDFSTTPQTASNSTASVAIPALGSAASALASTVSTTFGATSDSGTAQSSVAAPVTLLGGLIKASAIKVDATTTYNSHTGTWSGAATTTLAQLTIAGKSITATPAANTSIVLPGVGRVDLNKQVKTQTSNGLEVQADAIVVQISTENSLGIPVGSTIVVGYTDAQGAGPLTGRLSGDAYGTSLSGGPISSGPTFEQLMPGQGTDGKPLSTSGVGTALGVLNAGVITDSVTGTDNATVLSGAAGSTVANVSVLGVLTVGAVSASASTSSGSGGQANLGGRVTLANLKVAGVASLPVNPPPNFKVALPGGGSLILNYQARTATGITVQGLRLTLPVIGTLTVASATAAYSS